MNPQLVAVVAFLVALLQFGLMWAVAAGVRLQRPVSVHWAVGMLLPASALVLVALRDTVPPAAGWLVANLVATLGLLAVRRGVALFARMPVHDREALLLLLVLGIALGVGAAADAGWVVVVTTSAVCGVALLRAASAVATGLSSEFGRLSARLCALPFALIGTLLAVRAVAAAVAPERFGQGVHVGLAFNVWLLVALSALVTLLNVGLASLVVLRLVRRLQHRNAHDPLTGVLNRRGLDAALARIARGRRGRGAGWAVLVLDIDHFKPVNDRHGHAAGDAVLARVAQALAAAVRPADAVGRSGGEEFVVLLPAADRPHAEAAAQRLRAVVGGLHHPELDPAVQQPVTVSIGVAVVAAGSGESPTAAWQRADRALYEAKAGGRDRVALAGDAPVHVTGGG